jgi:quercetin dioxygenase-like cupin family protein
MDLAQMSLFQLRLKLSFIDHYLMESKILKFVVSISQFSTDGAKVDASVKYVPQQAKAGNIYYWRWSHLTAAGGLSVWCLGVLVTIKALANETGGTYSLFEDIVPPGIGPPMHIHTREEETWYMLDGELTWNVGGKSFHATKGSFIHLPRGVPHNFINLSDEPAHMVLTYAPGGFDQWFLEVGEPVSDRYAPQEAPPLTPELVNKAVTLGETYGIIFVDHHAKKDELDLAEMHGSL